MCGCCVVSPQELWLSVGDTLPDDEDEVQEELRKIGG
jgi:hypothetical protein